MKKKIVYISGADVFDVNDVRAAFEEVRNALKLGTDTILFGVPVDEDAEEVFVPKETAPIIENSTKVEPLVENESVDEKKQEIGMTEDDANMAEVIAEPIVEPIVEETQIVEVVDNAPADTGQESVVPILSVLASKEENEIEDVPQEPKPEPVKETKTKTKKTRAKKVATEPVEPQPDNIEEDMSDILNDKMPEEPTEKTLEQLLETMEPLREDVTGFHEKSHVDDMPITTSEEIDATLEKLAGEFAENQDNMPTNKKGSERGKIGKLKSILPFKKMKRDDSGLMGDLFGWAGIAANDDDFTMPGFFK